MFSFLGKKNNLIAIIIILVIIGIIYMYYMYKGEGFFTMRLSPLYNDMVYRNELELSKNAGLNNSINIVSDPYKNRRKSEMEAPREFSSLDEKLVSEMYDVVYQNELASYEKH